ncbi:MAG: hypothetical protein AAGF12_20190, partial [Myxococcota bacterium]
QPQCGFELHGFNAVYLRGHDRWVRVDPRGNKPGVDAQFSLAEERLAFATDPSKGEAIDPKGQTAKTLQAAVTELCVR